LETKLSLQGGEESAVGTPRDQGWEQLQLMSSFINDLEKGVNCEITMFGEDAKAFLIVKQLQKVVTKLI